MRKTVFLLSFFLFCTWQNQLRSQVYGYTPIYISEEGLYKLLRVNAGITQFSIRPTDSITKTARGIHLSNEVKIVSGFMDPRDHFTVHDAFYFDINLGLMPTSQQRIHGTEKESRFSVVSNFGYYALAGYRNNKWAALGGVDFRWRVSSVGGYRLPWLDGPLLYYSFPLVLRGEYGFSKNNANRRFVGMVWNSFGHKRAPYQSVRLEFPFDSHGRFWLCGQYTRQKAKGDDEFVFAGPWTATFTQWMLGLRVGILP